MLSRDDRQPRGGIPAPEDPGASRRESPGSRQSEANGPVGPIQVNPVKGEAAMEATTAYDGDLQMFREPP